MPLALLKSFKQLRKCIQLSSRDPELGGDCHKSIVKM